MTLTQPKNVSELIPTDAQYGFDSATSLADVTIETQRTGEPVAYATVTARLSVGVYGSDETPEYAIDAEYVSHEGDCSAEQIEYALRVIETNDFGV
jgi:hypothetical protein